MTATYALEARGLRKAYGDRPALRDVDLQVREGSVHALLGPNGAGKTTLLRALFGLVHLDAGELRLFGRGLDDGDRLAGVSGFVETPAFYPYLTGRSNLRLLSAYDDVPGAPGIEQVLREVGLVTRADERVGGYSLGMRQRLGLAAALLRRPRLLVLDEPDNGLDPAGSRELRALVRGAADRGLTVLLCSHDMAEVDGLCDEVTVLSRGAVAWTGSMSGMRAQAPDPTSRLVTSDDRAALGLATPRVRVQVHPAGGLCVEATTADLDRYVLALAAAGIAVRSLALEVAPLEQAYFALTGSAR